LDLYLKIMEEVGLSPNFWCSKDYLKLIGAKQVQKNGWVWIEDDSMCLFPPLYTYSPDTFKTLGISSIWSDFNGMHKNKVGSFTFLDYEFIYDPKDFHILSGRKWAKFRKNSRKWQNRAKVPVEYVKVKDERFNDGITEILSDWLDVKGRGGEIHDGEALVDAALTYPNRAVLYTESMDKVWGLNIWDENYKYVNYRWVIAEIDEEYLDEYMRLWFYKTLPGDKLVNDGGCLDNQNLYRFKKSLNPVEINSIYSWSR
jgi:hypothetical protein